MGIWIGGLWVSQAVAEKIQSQHGLSLEDVSEAIIRVRGLRYRWHDHPERGLRLLVFVEIGAATVLVVLYPRPFDAYGDAWNLGSAYPVGP